MSTTFIVLLILIVTLGSFIRWRYFRSDEKRNRKMS